MKSFLTVFPAAKNVHLIKDVGMIPYVLHKELKYKSTLLCYKNDDYQYLHHEVKGLKIIFLKKIFHHSLLDVLFFFAFNARKYDVVQVYHLRRISLIFCYLFKVFTFGRIKTYLKLDADHHIMDYQPSKTIKYIIKHIDLVSIENKTYLTYLNQHQILGREVCYVPNGFYDNGIRKAVDLKAKQNIILTVGRIGTKQKATEVLCEAFKIFAGYNTDWTLEIIGPIEAHFKQFIVDYYKENPSLKERVTFTGPIYNRIELEQHYHNAKVFALSSRYEGFPLVLTEAARFGCYIISTDLPAARDLINDEHYGSVFPIDDEQVLVNQLKAISIQQAQLNNLMPAIQSFAYRYFYWPEICKTINQLLWK
jgi:glycosyltransferase involved in cell wall biosynthesis